jgi:hypothetical protein
LYLACEHEDGEKYLRIVISWRYPSSSSPQQEPLAAPRLQSGEVTYDAPVQGTITMKHSARLTFTSAAADRISVRVERLDGNLSQRNRSDNNQQEVAQKWV